MKQRGVAIIMAILVVALAASAASFIAWQQHLWLRQAENLRSQAQAFAISQAALDWARLILQEDAKGEKVDHLSEAWATSLPATPVEGGEFTGGIRDAQGLFNLNNLAATDSNALELFGRLLTTLQLPAELANAAKDWVDPDDEVSFPGGAENLDYLGLQQPYRCANRFMTDVNNLYRVKGFTAEIVKRLRPFVTALPSPTPVNVNTAPPEVIAALFEDMAEANAKELVEKREKTHFQDIAAFKAETEKFTGLKEGGYDVKSGFFTVQAATRFGRAQLNYTALIFRTDGQSPRVMSRRQQ